MSCPEGDLVLQSETDTKEATETCPNKAIKVSPEGSPASLEFSSPFGNPKSWKKSFTNFFRNQIRSSRSIDGDGPTSTVTKDKYEDKEISSELKWQSLGKVFRRQSYVEPWNKASKQHGESSTQNKRLAVRKVLSNYFGKSQKSIKESDNK